jgi:hypothetical protein
MPRSALTVVWPSEQALHTACGCLLQVLYHCYAGLSAYVDFVQREQQQRRRPEAVPVEVAAGKEKGKDKELTLVLTRDYYEQVNRKNSQAALLLSLDLCCMSQSSIAHAGAPALNAYGVKLMRTA